METSKLKVVKDFPLSQQRTAAAIGDLTVKADEQNNILGPIPVRKGLRLDVDEILRRSLPGLSQPAVGRPVNN